MKENKKVLILSLGPVFKNYIHGGSQKILRNVALELGKKNEVTILCNTRRDNNKNFFLGNNVFVKPILQFKETFPAAYYTPPYRLDFSRRIIKKHLSQNDVVYMHDAGILFQNLFDDIPLVISPRDLLYPETLLGVLNFTKDKMIVATDYMKESILSFSRTPSLLEKKIEVIPNGINSNLFHYVDPTKFKKKYNIKDGSKILLYPHRVSSKGLTESLQVVENLVSEGVDIKLMIPEYIDSGINKDLRKFYDNLRRKVSDLNLESNVLIHDWVSQEQMPMYYSLGDVTLCIGTFPESFGNVSLESIMCGTPAVVSKVAAQREVIPDNLMDKVDPLDVKQMTNMVKKVFKNKPNLTKIQEYIIQKYNYRNMVTKYSEIITSFSKRDVSTHIIDDEVSYIEIPPWCYINKKGIYNDYVEKTAYSSIANVLKHEKSIEYNELIKVIGTNEIQKALSEGFIRGYKND